MTISQDLLDILCCPKCKGDLTLSASPEGFVCAKCGLLYPIRDGIPIMLTTEAIPIKPENT
ncbi:MAG: Trm112 family protein [Syntrophorhabdaceae bacterium]|nr:Trm112 family protein [Syntrophorhabdaceae bacterium]MDD4197426.1 Trm112 family protein [Syntrophorhabdaceae bacterium]HOC46991.1 Trm112 family protein [Syntrophorhabdaceae bacterium]